jgi:hypothetical protein
MENTVLLGLWYDKNKPNFNTLLQPALEFFKNFKAKGVRVNHTENDSYKCLNLKGKIICTYADAPARALVSNATQYNGHNGCGFLQDPISLSFFY